jgi:hypothetical protein
VYHLKIHLVNLAYYITRKIMSSIWEKMGAVFEKPQAVRKELSPEAKEELRLYHEKLGSFHSKINKQLSKEYSEIIPKPLLLRAMEHNNYDCGQWGSRKFGRLVNICRNLLDIEIHSEEGYLFEGSKNKKIKEEKMILRLLVISALLFPIPLKKQMLDMDADEKYKVIFKDWLVSEFNLVNENEYNIVEAIIFEGVNNNPGNVIIDIFHDALRFEEAQFQFKVNPKQMRTVLGKSDSYRAKVIKESERNLSPGWLVNFQEKYDLDCFVDASKANEDNSAMGDDGIS